jgi:hypothetical protein
LKNKLRLSTHVGFEPDSDGNRSNFVVLGTTESAEKLCGHSLFIENFVTKRNGEDFRVIYSRFNNWHNEVFSYPVNNPEKIKEFFDRFFKRHLKIS